jgi:hypothetical protein
MSKIELVKCDSCGLVQGEDGRSSQQWAEILPPSDSSSIMFRITAKKHYCLNCWSEIEKTLPALRKRPCAPKN